MVQEVAPRRRLVELVMRETVERGVQVVLDKLEMPALSGMPRTVRVVVAEVELVLVELGVCMAVVVVEIRILAPLVRMA